MNLESSLKLLNSSAKSTKQNVKFCCRILEHFEPYMNILEEYKPGIKALNARIKKSLCKHHLPSDQVVQSWYNDIIVYVTYVKNNKSDIDKKLSEI